MPRPPSSPLQRYGLAIALVVAATAARVALGPALGQRQPFATFYIALILSAWYGGLGPSIVAMTLGGLSALYFFIAPIGFFTPNEAADVVGVGLYFGVGAALIAFAEANRVTRRRLEREVVERSRAEASIAEQLRLAEYGRDIGLALTEGGSLRGVLARCAEVTVRSLDGALARIWMLDEAGEVLELQASAGLDSHLDGAHARIPIGEYKIGRIARERRPHLENGEVDDTLVPDREWAGREGLSAFAGFPLIVDDRVAGVFAMFSRRPLSEATLRAMESVARGIAVGIEQRWAEERLHEQREWLRVTLASIGDAVIATDTDGRVAFLNHVAETLTGWTAAEASGRPLGEVFRIVNEASRLPVESPVEKALREGQVVGLANHTLLIARDDAERPIDDSAAPIRDERGEIVGVVLIFRDVTERRRAERRVRQGEARKAAILETALDAIITIDHEGKFVEINPAAETIFGHARGDVLGREMCELIVPPSLREAHRRGMARYLATGEGPVLGRRFEITALRADGTEFPVELSITPISADGPPMFTAHVRDITERKRFERRREARLAVTEILAGASSIVEAIPKILRAVGEGLGWDVGELWTVAPEGDRLQCLGVWRSPNHPADEFEAVARRTAFPKGIGLPGRVWSGGRPCWVPDVTADSNFPRAPIAAREGLHGAFGGPITLGGEVLGAVAFYSGEVRQPDDDTLEMMATLGGQIGQFFERKRAEEALVEADRHKDEFLATLAHELRNPLAPIRNSLHILKSPDADRALVEPVWEMMERQVYNMTRLVDDLMDVSRIHWGKIELRREAVDLASVVRRAVEASMPLIKERQHDLRVDLPDTPVRLEGDPTRLEQILDNLLNNAAKYTDPGGRIRLVAALEGDLAVIRVRDSGIGIAHEMLSKVFGLFVQAERRLDRSKGGLGIGLSLVRQLVEMHGGTIRAHSEGPGRGSEFVVRLPALSGEEVPPLESCPVASPSPSPSPARRRILVVDDNVDSARTMALLLVRLWKQEVQVAHDGPSAVEAALSFHPEVILLDIGLPGLSGYEVAERLRRRPEFAGTLLVAMTGWGQEEDRRRSREAGFDRHLVKPVDPDALRALLAHAAGSGA